MDQSKTSTKPGADALMSLIDEDASFIGRMPLDKFKTLLEQKADGGIVNLDLHCMGYVTDAVLKVMKDVFCSKKEYREKLVTIDLTGCFNVTDIGAAWLADIASQSPNLVQIRVDGCPNITDSGFTALYNAKPGASVSAMATSVSFINLGASMRGCPLLIDTKGRQEKTELMYSQCMVVPHSGLDTSMADYLNKKKVETRNGRPLCHVTNWKNGDWRISLNELELSNPLFDVIVPHNPTQVLIPFDASADIRDIRTHVANTITRVLNKETVNPGHKLLDTQKSRGSTNFMDVHTLQKVDFTLDGLLKNISTSEQVIGAFCSRQPLSQSNNYFEVEVVSTDGTKELGIVLGCMFDVLYSDRSPMEANEKKGGAVDGFEIAAGEVYGFGVSGRWDSEYVPSEDSSYYYTKNGAIVTDKVPSDVPHIGMFPLCSIIGKGLAEVRIKNINSPPKAVVDQWEKETKTFQPSFMHNMLCDDTGVLSYIDSYKNVGETGLCVNMLPVTSVENSLTVKLLAEASDGCIRVGIGPESYKLRSSVGSNETTPGYGYARRRVPANADASIGYEFKSGEVFNTGKSEDKKGPVLKIGDELTVTVKEQQNKLISPDDTVTVRFTVNGNEDSAVETIFKYTAKTGNRCVFLISMSKPGEQVLIKNYRKPYFSPPPKMNFLTMARSHFINVLDDGRLSYRQFDQRNMFGLFVSKTPFNKNLCDFKLLVQGISRNKHIGIGLCHRDYKINTMPGWMYGSIGYHADNGKLYHCSSHGKYTINSDTQSVIFGAGDTIGCRIDPEKTEFREDGSIKPQQSLTVYFSKNGTEVHEEKFQYQSDGLFPCVALHHEGDAVQLLNYFSGCQPVPEQEEVEKKTEKKEEEKEGCEFVLVSVGSGSVDEKSKLDLLKNQLNLDSDLSSISQLSEEVANLEKKLGSQDLQGQNYYSGLCWSLECLERICRQKDRLHFLSLNTKTGEGYENLVKKISSIQSAHKEKYKSFYHVHSSVKEGLDKLLAEVETQCIVRVSKLQELTENVFESFGHVYKQAVKALHSRGKLLCFKLLDSEDVAVDLTFLERMFERVMSVEEGHTDRRITAVGEGSLLWTEETITSSTKLGEDRLYLLKQLLLQMGFLQLPCLRTEPTDPHFLYSKLGKLSSKVSLADYWSKGTRPDNTVVMWRTYQFPAGVPSELLSTLLTMCSRFSQIQLITKEGGVLKNGAVQTTIIAHKTDSRVEAVTVESKCYVPDVDEGPINDDTRYFVQEYTWNVFCILSDVVDSHLRNCGLSPIIKQDLPTWFANTSVGCKHEWVLSDADVVQSVCTLCEKCCDLGSECPWNGIMGRYLRQCPCGTRVTGCKSCGICKQCAQLLWKLRSRLRPCCEVTRGDGKEILDAVPLNGFTFNQVDCVNLHVNNQPICLRKLNDPTAAMIQVFPGPAVHLPTMKRLTDYNKSAKFNKAMQFNPGDTVTVSLQEVKKDESQLLEMEQAEEDMLEIKPVFYTCICREARVSHETGIVCYDSASASIPVAQFVGARPLTVECNKFSIEVVKPGKGRYIAIGLVPKRYQMNRQPGWDASSIGYHADDGGIFVGSGWPLQRVGAVDVGEVMTCELDLDANKVTFYKGDKKVYQSNRIRIPAGGFHPCVALHSQGEALRILDFDAWLPPKEGEITTLPQAFDTYKYGNLWISPGHTITLQQSNVTQGWLILHNPSKDLVGYLVKSNPTAVDIVGQMEPGKSNPTWVEISQVATINSLEIVWFTLDSGRSYTQEDIQNVFKTLTTESYHTHKLKVKIQRSQQAQEINLDRAADREPKPTDMYLLEVKRNGSLLDSYYLKRGKYTCRMPLDSDIGKLGLLMRCPAFPTFDQPNMFQRGMRLIAQPSMNTYAECVVADVSFDGYALTLEYSPKGADDNTLLCVEMTSDAIQLEELPLEVIEEMSTVIKGDKDAKKDDKGDKSGESEKVEKSEQEKESEKLASADFLFDDSSDDDDDFLEGIDSFSLLTKSKKSQDDIDNVKPEEPTEKKQEKKEIVKADVEIYGYESRGNMAVEKRAYMFPPPCLLNNASRYAIMALDSKWRVNSLESIAKCYSVPTRITVQELQITELSKKLLKWMDNRRKERRIDQAFVFLPAQLDAHKLCHFQVPQLFTDIEVHRLCYLVDQIYQMWRDEDEMTLDLPIHFVNMPPIKPQTSLPANLMYACLISGWNYTSLTATQLVLPVYDKIFSGTKPDHSRQEVESLLWSLLRVYTSQCHILAEQYGGMDLQDSCPKRTKDINKAIAYNDVNVQRSSGALVDDPSVMVIRKFKNSCMCKAHQMTFEGGMVVEMPDFPYEHKDFEPYQENVNYFCRELHTQDSLPSDFFAKFPNLQLLALDLCSNLTSLPSGISQCSRLKIVTLSTSAIKELPSDIFLSPSLSQLQCSYLPVKSLPTEWPASSQLTKLTLYGLQLTQVPSEICQLQELQTLNLSCNPLSDIPVEIGKLQKLKRLDLSGMPWPTLGGDKTVLLRDQFEEWFADHSFVKNFLNNFDASKMFLEHDHNKSGSLDEEGLASLNVKLFSDIPRIGCNSICDTEYGGIPSAIFLLTSLEELYLDYNAITAVPVHMCRLVNLHVLSLSYNPLLESLPGSLGHLPNMKTLNLMGCPSLRTPPNEVVSRGFESVKAYLKRLAGGFTACRRTKLMLVGLGGAGKTSLLKALMSQNKKTEGTKGEDITDGIVIQPWTVKTQTGLDITFNTWDFAGQTLYYNTHQFFLSKRAVYILLWSTRQGFEHAGLEFWLSSIDCHAPKTPIFVVGTHCDQVPKADIPTAELSKRYPQIVGFHFVSSIQGTGIAELEERLLEVTLEQKNMGEKIPQVWLNLEHKILAARPETSILKWSVIKDYGMEVGIYDEKDIKEAIQFLHELGTVQYFDNDFLRDKVVINPQWIVNVMSCVVSVKDSPIQAHKGRFRHEDIQDIWKQYPKSLHKWLLQLTEEFDLTFPLPKDPVNIVPCLLPQEEPEELDSAFGQCCGDNRQTKMVYKFAYLPAGLFNRAQVRLFQFSDGKLIWKRGSLLNKNNHIALIKQTSDSELVVLVQGPRPENILFLVHEIFESLIEEFFHGVKYDFMVPCPDCLIKEGCLDPCFDAELISHAKDKKAPFLQCRKYFHTVSMAQLLEIMPNNHAGDFDAHLQHSIMMLQELNSALTMDVAILYSSADVPAPSETGEKIHPVWVKEDLEKLGLSCWYCDDMLNVSIQDLTLALKNCKVVVALVSDNFERDEKCRDMMMYAMDSLNKEYIITLIGTSLAWQNTDLGMRIGKQEQMVMIKTKSRYKDRIQELQDAVKSKLHGIQIKDNKEYPVCFISYCWANSQDAVKKGTKEKPGALGWGDPRKIKHFLEKNGVSTWIDCEQMSAGKGLFENICQGMRHARVLVVCVSDEYIESENCMMEIRFGVLNLNLPLVLVVVGTGKNWKQSEVGILAMRGKADRVYLQQENPSGLDTLLQYVKTRLPSATDSLIRKEAVKKEMTEMQKKASKQTNVVLQEEYELTQRRFMRHIIDFVSKMDSTPMPRLVVIDFDRTDRVTIGSHRMSNRTSNPDNVNSPSYRHSSRTYNPDTGGLEREGTKDSVERSRSRMSRPTLRPKTATKSKERMEAFRPEQEDWETENFCVKLLCEFEEGWHLCEHSFPLRKTEESKDQLKKLAPYLARIFAILKQSSMPLSCLSSENGKQFIEWLEQESQGSDFLEAYQALRAIITEHELAAESFLNQLSRCHLPSGKVFWLCEKHQSGPRITKLSRDVGTRLNQRRVVFREDVLLKELIEKSPTYLKKKGEKAKQIPKKVYLPPKETTKPAERKLEHKTSAGSLNSKSQEETTPDPVEADNSGENMAPVRGSTSGKQKEAKSPPPTKMHPVNRTKSKPKFKAVGNAAGTAYTASKAGSEKGSKACTVQ